MAACPYDALERANLVLCEADLCAWIAQPAAAWSNIGFVIAASIIWKCARESEDRSLARLLAPIALATGLASFAFHATGTLAGQLVDQSVMFLETALFMTIGERRFRRASAARSLATYVGVVGISVAMLLEVPTSGIALFVAHGVVIVGIESVTVWKTRHYSVRWALYAVATLAASFALWWLDAERIVCDPDNHLFTGHAAWHLLGALSFLFWYRHFAQPQPRPTI